MRMFRWFSLLGGLLFANLAFAQYGELSVSGGAGLVSDGQIGQIDGGRVTLDSGFRMIFRVTLNSESFWGHEFGYAYNRTSFKLEPDFQQGTAIHYGFYNFLLYATPEGTRIRPFVTGGGHFANFIFPGGSVQFGGGENKFGVNYGGGIKARIVDFWGVRLDFREYLQGKPWGDFLQGPGGRIKVRELSGGLSFLF